MQPRKNKETKPDPNQSKLTSFLHKPIRSTAHSYAKTRVVSPYYLQEDQFNSKEGRIIQKKSRAEDSSSKAHIMFLIMPPHMTFWQTFRKRFQTIIQNVGDIQCTVDLIEQSTKIYSEFVKDTHTNLDNLHIVMEDQFLLKAIPYMAKQCLRKELPAIRMLYEGGNENVEITRRDAFYVLSHMFFGTMPYQLKTGYKNLVALMDFDKRKNKIQSEQDHQIKTARLNQSKVEKLRCFIYYFINYMKLSDTQKNQEIVFKRVHVQNKTWQELSYASTSLSQVFISQDIIEDHSENIMIDFANKNLGGGVLRRGCVQEEILFATHPELVVSTLIFPALLNTEAAIFQRFRKYSNYTGYAQSFKFRALPLNHKHNYNIMVAIDAFDFSYTHPANIVQIQDNMIEREIKKAWIGIAASGVTLTEEGYGRSIATGRWGCGAFKGTTEVKFLIQWIVCSLVGVPMIFCLPGGSSEEQEGKEEEETKIKETIKTGSKEIDIINLSDDNQQDQPQQNELKDSLEIKKYKSLVKYLRYRKFKVKGVLKIFQKYREFIETTGQPFNIFDYILDMY